jgi:ubiquitin
VGEVEEGENVLLSYDEKLNKNLEDFMIRWFDSFGPHSTFYQQYIEPNDMLRLFACPESYNSGVDDLTNYEMFMVSCFRCVHDYSKKMSKEVNEFFTFCKCSSKTSSKDIKRLEDN